jgi:hypothetical protein
MEHTKKISKNHAFLVEENVRIVDFDLSEAKLAKSQFQT